MALILEDDDVKGLLSMPQYLEAMEIAYRDFGHRTGANHPRVRLRSPVPDKGYDYGNNVHIGLVPSLGFGAVRIGSGIGPGTAVAPGGGPRQRVAPFDNRDWGVVCLFSLETAQLLCIYQEFSTSNMRVGATTGLAAKYLAKPDATTLGMFGSGKLARTNLEAIAVVRPIQRVRVYSPTKAHREAYAEEESRKLGIEVVPVERPDQVVPGMDIVCCSTNAGYVSGEPVFDGNQLEPGQLVISIQNSDVHGKKSEVDETTFRRSASTVINDKESVFSNGQLELLDPIDQGLLSWDNIHELGDIVAGKVKFTQQPSDIVHYKNNTGMGIQFAAAGALLYREAVRRGVGHEVPTEWFGTLLSKE